MPIFDQLQRASFDGVSFPVESVEVTSDLRHHVHEYPHTSGGDPEKLGRGLYRIHMAGNFQATFRAYPKLWPEGLSKLRHAYEEEKTADLVIPTLGTMRAFITKWKQRANARTRSGEKAEIEFLEHQPEQFLRGIQIHSEPFGISAAALRLEAESLRPSPSLFDDIQSLVNAVVAFADTASMYGNLFEAKLLQLKGLCEQADRLNVLQDPAYHRVLDALHAIWASTLDALSNLQGKPGELETFVVPMTMPVTEISRAIYGDATHAVDILQLNPIEDAFRVPAGMRIRHYFQ